MRGSSALDRGAAQNIEMRTGKSARLLLVHVVLQPAVKNSVFENTDIINIENYVILCRYL